MNWLEKTGIWIREKLNPAQETIYHQEGTSRPSDASINYNQAFDKLESVNRGVGMVVAACASLDYDIKDKTHDGLQSGVRVKSLNTLLNFRPNPYQSIQDFRSNLFTDFLLEGNAFIYYDGVYLYHLPAVNVEILVDPKTFIKGYKYIGGTQEFSPEEVVYFKDLSSVSIYRGTSRLKAADRNIKTLYKMQDFQNNFFENGAISGLVFTTDNTLSQVAKDRTINNWMVKFSHKNGGKKPMIVDSGLKPVQLLNNTFQEMDFEGSIKSHNIKILETIGVPPVLLDGGNQANISPNLRLLYLETVMPIVRKYVSAMEQMFGYDIDAITSNVSSLQPDLKDIAMYYTTLANGGILTQNEAREELRYPKDKDPESDKLHLPANIAGSAVNATQGGAPKKPVAEPTAG